MIKPMTVQEFLQYVKDHEYKYISYCEILINTKGEVILSIPSHTEALVREIMMIEHCTREDLQESIPMNCEPINFMCDKYNYCAVWYQAVLTPLRVTKEQSSTIQILKDNRVIDPNATISPTYEYLLHGWRKTIFGAD